MCENKENCLPRDAPRARAAARPTTKSDRRSGVRPAFDRSVSRPFRSSLKPVAKGTGDRSEDPEILLLAVEALAERRPNRRGVVIAPRAPRRPRRRGERRRSFARARARGRNGGRARSRTRVLARGDGRDRRSSEDQIPNVHRAAVDDRGPTTDRPNARREGERRESTVREMGNSPSKPGSPNAAGTTECAPSTSRAEDLATSPARALRATDDAYAGNYASVMLQGFHWTSCEGGLDGRTWYAELRASIPELVKTGVNVVWLTPPSQSVSAEGVPPAVALRSQHAVRIRARAAGADRGAERRGDRADG